jgi:flagellar hook-associated protein 1 FlgK
MAGDILSIGKSGLFAAQAGLSTTGNNITNANVAGYSRQVVVQSTTLSVKAGNAFYGTGTQVASVKRYTDDFLTTQVRTAQASASSLSAYNAQIGQVDNLLADTTSGLSPALQDFFNSVQDVTSNRGSDASRQSMISSGQALSARLQGINGRLQEIREGVNGQIQSDVGLINSYADQIAQLNTQISGASGDPAAQPNDLLDKRDQLIVELNQYVKATVTPGEANTVKVSIGSGLPLVVGKQTYKLAATTAPTDQSRVAVGYQTGAAVTVLDEKTLSGGELGGLLDFRANALDTTQNSLGRLAVGLAMTINGQQQLGVDQQGQQGTAMFTYGQAFVGKNINNNTASTTSVSATISDPSKLTTSDYKVEFDGTDFQVTRLSDNQKTKITGVPQTIDGVDFSISGSAATGDNFIVRPTVNGAEGFNLALTDPSQIAAAIPIATAVPLANKGTGAISSGAVDASYFAAPLGAPVTLAFSGGQLTGFPASAPVTVTTSSGAKTTYAAGAPVPYSAGASISFGGMSVSIQGVPADGDTFTISPSAADGDTRNATLMGALQTTNIFNNGSATYQTAFAQMVSFVGNKAREAQVNGKAADGLLTQAQGAAQNVSGVNLDEEATNLLRYQQAYQASGKIMQIANTVFDTLLSIGGN